MEIDCFLSHQVLSEKGLKPPVAIDAIRRNLGPNLGVSSPQDLYSMKPTPPHDGAKAFIFTRVSTVGSTREKAEGLSKRKANQNASSAGVW